MPPLWRNKIRKEEIVINSTRVSKQQQKSQLILFTQCTTT